MTKNTSREYNVQFYQHTSSLAVFSLISAILSYLLVPLAGAVAAIITGHMARKQIKDSGGLLIGDGMATWGVVLGWINIVVITVPLCFFVLLISLGVVSIPVCLIPFFDFLIE